MSILTHNKKEDDCYTLINRLSLYDSDSQKIQGSFSRFPNGFFINNTINADLFFEETIKEPTGKDKLSKIISSIQIIKKLGTSSFEVSIPSSLFEKNEKLSALKLINDAIIIWTDNFVYKIPISEKAVERFKNIKENINLLTQLDLKLQNYFLIPNCVETNNFIIQSSIRCKTIALDSNSTTLVDNFLHKYFTDFFRISKKEDILLRGFQHGDLHYRNLLMSKDNQLLLTDLDLIKLNGFPFLDLMHFAIHLVRSTENTNQYKPLELFLVDKRYLYDKLLSFNFYNLSELWLQYYHDEYISLYIHSQIEWYYYNKVISNELSQLEELKKKFLG